MHKDRLGRSSLHVRPVGWGPLCLLISARDLAVLVFRLLAKTENLGGIACTCIVKTEFVHVCSGHARAEYKGLMVQNIPESIFKGHSARMSVSASPTIVYLVLNNLQWSENLR